MNIGKLFIDAKRPQCHQKNGTVLTDLEADDDQEEEDEDEDEDQDKENEPEEDEGLDGGDMFEDISLLARRHLENEMSQNDSTIASIARKYVPSRNVPFTQDGSPRAAEIARFERLNADLDSDLRERLRSHTLISVPPLEDDWMTWEVPVPTGKEETTVYNVLLIADHGGVYRQSTPPRSAYTAPGVTGRVYVEAKTKNDVITLFKPIHGIRWWEIKVEVLPRDGLRVTVIPRLWYHRPPDFKQPRKHSTAKPFDRGKALEVSGPSSVMTTGVGLTSKHYYFDIRYDFFPPHDSYTSYDSSGFQDLVIGSSEYLPIDVYPQLSEILPFMTCVSIPHAVKLLNIRLADNRRLKNGDRVLVVSTPQNINTTHERHVGRTGIIDGISDSFAYVYLPDIDSGLSEAVQIPLSSIRRHYKIGDYVKAHPGSPRERAGWVTGVNDAEDQLTIYDPEGRSGIVRTLSMRLKATVELQASHSSSRSQLEELSVGDLAFELDLHKWYRLLVKNTGDLNSSLDVQLEAVHTIPSTCSMLAESPEKNRSQTPEPQSNSPVEEGPWSPNYPSPSARGIPAGVVPEMCWLMKLPHLNTFRTLKLSIQSFGGYENGKWDGKIGFYKGLSGSQVKFFSQECGLLLVPFFYVNPVHPTKAPQNAHCLAEGPDLGKRFKVQTVGEEECEVVPFHGVEEFILPAYVPSIEMVYQVLCLLIDPG
ncbi:hypothetical protein NP233_g7856 [Leucocoprinus birnbaumii]|uniref:Chromatin elongation factor SPT5 n=1 Tax=Leucocoprinus birnbaumii TaxID=56174 RepID=A0AAD5YUC7_9AGAR|nr:hypothetical protein NP233_g7856 [Leucocoprinus birnbaumii]